jgi:phenylacetate-CoA ligase
MIPRSTVRGIEWPALPEPGTAALLALAWQLEHSQWWPAERLAREQAAQRAHVLAHAVATTPHYAGLDAADWASVPVMTRDDVIAAGARLRSTGYPAAHGPVEDVFTSRTSGEPVRVCATGVTSLLWQAITLRDHAWHRRDLDARLATIRYVADGAAPPDGTRARGWGRATEALAPDAPVSVLSVASTTDEQVAWLLREDPVYLLLYPTVLDAIVRRLAATGQRLPALREVRTISEMLTPETRALCRDVLGVPVVDTYSAQEVGYIALQCPDGERYHVQAERLFVELLDDAGAPCRPGELGRVVVTDLHNFATPILRYDLGDYAELGAPCPCGRGLPVLTRIAGRRRGMLVYPDGRTTWPVFTIACRAAARYRELQLVQEPSGSLRLRVVPDPAAPLTAADRAALATALATALGHPFTIAIDVVDALARSPAGKLEEFVSRVAR